MITIGWTVVSNGPAVIVIALDHRIGWTEGFCQAGMALWDILWDVFQDLAPRIAAVDALGEPLQ